MTMEEPKLPPTSLKVRTKHKGGRPPKSEEEKRDIRVPVYYDQPTYDAIKAAAESVNVGVSRYIYEVSKNGYVRAPISKPFADEFRQFAAVGNNLNQLTHLAHVKGMESIRSRLELVLQSIEEIILAIANKL